MRFGAAVARPGSARRLLLGLACLVTVVNLGARLDREMVDVWDESIFAAHALDMHRSRQWVVTTVGGEVDYFDTKPPLNSWLVAASFDAFGVGLVSLRLPAVLSAAATVLVTAWWASRVFPAPVAPLAAVVLATTYPFLYVHAARTANADAPLALVLTLLFVATWHGVSRPGRLAAVGPLAVAACMLKGPAALGFVAPLTIAAALAQRRAGTPSAAWLLPLAAGTVAALVPAAIWVAARWQFDGWRFLGAMVHYDVLERATTAIQGHDEPWHYYVNVLLRHHYEWLTASVVAVAMAGRALADAWARVVARHPQAPVLVGGWCVATVAVPTLLPTRLAWYLLPFYPGAAVFTALAVSTAWSAGRRAGALAAVVLLALGVAEGRIVYRSFARLDVQRSPQGLLLAHGDKVRRAQVFARSCPAPETFLIAAAGGTCHPVADLGEARQYLRPGDLWIDAADAVVPGFTCLGRNRGASLHQASTPAARR